MKERPILFNTPMVRAVLEGRKSQTRRVIKPQPKWFYGGMPIKTADADPNGVIRCPYGSVGTRLWVRETWAALHRYDHLSPKDIPKNGEGFVHHKATWSGPCGLIWRRSIHMPRWASRITIEVVDVRVERVQDISEDDAEAEGVDAISLDAIPRQATWSRKKDFAQLWDFINMKRGCGWSVNPWVWVVDFKVVNDELCGSFQRPPPMRVSEVA